MRILFLQDHLRIGGTEKQTLALAGFGKSIRHQTGVIVFRPGGSLKPDTDSIEFYAELQPFNTRIDEWAPSLISKIRQFKPEAIVFMGKVSHLYLLKIRKYLPGTTFIATFRSGKPPVPYYAKALENADGVIINSQVERDRLIKSYGLNGARSILVHNGCLLKSARETTAVSEHSSLRILCTAMFRPQKNQKELIRILAKLPKDLDWQCTFAGTGKTLKACKQLVRELRLEDRVNFTWSTDPQGLYAEHDIAVLTSDKESLPNSLIEAQFAGLPVVAYLVNGVKECFDEGVSGFGIPLGDQQGFLDAITLLAQDEAKREAMAKAALHFGQTHFGFDERSKDFFEAIQEIHEEARRA